MIPPRSIRELRELVRYRHKLSQLRSGPEGQIHAVLGREGVVPYLTGMWGPAGHAFLNLMGDAYEYRLESLRDWLPTPSGPFWPIFRTYGPGKAILDHSWKLPTIKRIG